MKASSFLTTTTTTTTLLLVLSHHGPAAAWAFPFALRRSSSTRGMTPRLATTMQQQGQDGSPASNNNKRVAVIGAGAAGLVASRLLREAGFACKVFEKSDSVGGVWKYRPEDVMYEVGVCACVYMCVCAHCHVYKASMCPFLNFHPHQPSPLPPHTHTHTHTHSLLSPTCPRRSWPSLIFPLILRCLLS